MGKNKEQQIEQMDGIYSADSYAFGDLGDTESFTIGLDHDEIWSHDKEEVTLREKYPALEQAWSHYQNILTLCKAKENEVE